MKIKEFENKYLFKLMMIIISLLSFLVIYITINRLGAGISPDSVGYIATARNLAKGTGFVNYDNSSLLVQPPLYPIILSFSEIIFKIDPLQSSGIISAIFFGLTIFISGFMFQKYVGKIFAFLGAIFLFFSIPLVRVYIMAWSEPPFVFFVALFFLTIFNYFEERNLKSLLFLSIIVALACLTRYIGLIIIVIGFISILTCYRGDIKTKFTHLILFLFISSLPIIIWVGRNYFLSKTFFGPRSPSSHTFYQNIKYSFDTILHWYLPGVIVESRLALLILGLIVGFIFGCLLVGIKKPFTNLRKQISVPVFISTLFIIGYVTFLIVSSTTTNYDKIGDRLLSPIAIPVTFLLMCLIEFLYNFSKRKFQTKRINLLLYVFIFLFLIYPVRSTALIEIRHFFEGSQYGDYFWKNSKTIEYIRENKLQNCTIFTNGKDVLYLYLNLNEKSIPSKSKGSIIVADKSDLQKFFGKEEKACIIWFNRINREYLFTPQEIISVTSLEKIITLDDGKIIFVSGKPISN